MFSELDALQSWILCFSSMSSVNAEMHSLHEEEEKKLKLVAEHGGVRGWKAVNLLDVTCWKLRRMNSDPEDAGSRLHVEHVTYWRYGKFKPAPGMMLSYSWYPQFP